MIESEMGFDDKVDLAKMKIRQWYDHWNGLVYVSWSGGMDSTVLLSLARSVEPGIPAVFCDSGQEYPEIRQFIKGGENVTWIKPDKNFRAVLEEDGLPLVSKRVSKQVRVLQERKPGTERSQHLYLTGTNTEGEYERRSKLPTKWLWLVDSGIKISEKCCEELKRKPFRAYQKATKRMPMLGLRADEGGERSIIKKRECNNFDKRHGRSLPLQFWTDKDIWDYVRQTGMKYCELYDQGEKRTGCMFCAFGADIEQKRGLNRFERLKKKHPKQWKYYMENIGLKEKLESVGVRTGAT
ncbi:MAG: hypothetical protein HW380_3699 [Magnetococcales bacterium]|nr:hypothetical protein [Magnetococcales bacterium]